MEEEGSEREGHTFPPLLPLPPLLLEEEGEEEATSGPFFEVRQAPPTGFSEEEAEEEGEGVGTEKRGWELDCLRMCLGGGGEEFPNLSGRSGVVGTID